MDPADALNRQSTFARQFVWKAAVELLVLSKPMLVQARMQEPDDESHMQASVPTHCERVVYNTLHLLTQVDTPSRSQNELALHCVAELSEHFSEQAPLAAFQSQVTSPMHSELEARRLHATLQAEF
jgi:hypothetical protein